MLISQKKETKQIVLNSIVELGEDLTIEKQGKGRQFTSRFIEAGIAHYSDFGDVLITKETLNKFIHTMVGCPLIINHKPINDKNADKERVGVISDVWYNEADGWFYCKGIIWDKQAIDLVKNQGWNVSCTYDFVSDNQPKTHNGKKIDLEFIDGNFQHLALVENPRYERANIVINSKDEVNNEKLKKDDIEQWITTEYGAKIPIKKGLTIKEGLKHFAKISHEHRKSKNKEKDEAYKVLASAIGKSPDYVKRHYNSKNVQELISKAKTDDSLTTKTSFDPMENFNIEELERADTNTQEKWIEQAQDIIEGRSKTKSEYESYFDEYGEYLADLDKKQKEIVKKSKGDFEKAEKELVKLYGVESLEDLSEETLTDFYKELNKYYEEIENKVNNGKDNAIMAVMDELKNFILSVVNNEDDKDEKKEKVENEDKRKLIDEVGGILKGKVDEEVWRTVIGKLEKIAYNPSETDKADNKCKNEDDEEKEEKEEKYEEMKEVANKKAKNEEEKDKEKDKEDKKEVNNSMDKAREMIMGGNTKVELKSNYVSQDERLKLGDNY